MEIKNAPVPINLRDESVESPALPPCLINPAWNQSASFAPITSANTEQTTRLIFVDQSFTRQRVHFNAQIRGISAGTTCAALNLWRALPVKSFDLRTCPDHRFSDAIMGGFVGTCQPLTQPEPLQLFKLATDCLTCPKIRDNLFSV